MCNNNNNSNLKENLVIIPKNNLNQLKPSKPN